MKKTILSFAVLIVMMTACKKETTVTTTQVAADTTAVKDDVAEASAPMDSISMMKAWEAYATPGEAHKNLAMDNGTWHEESTMWMSPDDPKPMKMTMTAVSKMIMGGRYQETRHRGTMEGQPFEGVSTIGYDNASKEMVSTWYDNMSTGIMYLTGKPEAGSKTTEFKGECTDPLTGKLKPIRETFTIVDANTRKMEMFDVTPDGKEYKSMEITMTRKK